MNNLSYNEACLIADNRILLIENQLYRLSNDDNNTLSEEYSYLLDESDDNNKGFLFKAKKIIDNILSAIYKFFQYIWKKICEIATAIKNFLLKIWSKFTKKDKKIQINTQVPEITNSINKIEKITQEYDKVNNEKNDNKGYFFENRTHYDLSTLEGLKHELNSIYNTKDERDKQHKIWIISFHFFEKINRIHESIVQLQKDGRKDLETKQKQLQKLKKELEDYINGVDDQKIKYELIAQTTQVEYLQKIEKELGELDIKISNEFKKEIYQAANEFKKEIDANEEHFSKDFSKSFDSKDTSFNLFEIIDKHNNADRESLNKYSDNLKNIVKKYNQ